MARSSDAIFPLSLIKDKTFQLQQIRRVMWITLFFIVQSTLLLGIFYHNLIGKIVAGTAPLLFASEELQTLSDKVPTAGAVMGEWLLWMLLLNALVTVAVAGYILRKLGNPMLAIRRALTDIGKGNLDVRLRTGDASEFSELSVALNEALEQIQRHIDDARAQTQLIEQLDQQPEPDPAEVRQALLNCRTALSFFDGPVVEDSNRPAANKSH
jgi:methyl-accepting chemotaxis protein